MKPQKIVYKIEHDKNLIIYYLNLLDDVNDSFKLYYNQDKKIFTDNSYVAYEYACQDQAVTKYVKQILALDGTCGLKFNNETMEFYYSIANDNGDTLAYFAQALSNAFTLLKLINSNKYQN